MRSRLILPVWFMILLAACKTSSRQEPASGGEILEKYWKLIEVQGVAVEVGAEKSREAYLSLKSESNRMSGSGSCNRFTGNFQIRSGNGVQFSGIAATKMHCAAMETEKKFFAALEETNHFQIRGDTLLLLRDRLRPVAKLVVVYMR